MQNKISWIDQSVNRLTYWYGAYTIVTAAFSYVASQLTFMQAYGWPEAVFVGAAAAAILMVCTSFGLIAWRYFKPLPAENTPIIDGKEQPQITTDQTGEIGRIGQIVKTLVLAHSAKEKIAFIDKKLPTLERLRIIEPKKPPSSLRNHWPGIRHNIVAEAKSVLGQLELAELEERIKRATDQITGNAIYCTLEGDDIQKFVNGEAKQAYHLSQHQIAATEWYFTELKRKLEEDTKASLILFNKD